MALLRIVILFLILIASPLCQVAAQNLQLYEQEVKVGMIYNFLKYTSWPSTNQGANVCILGDSALSTHLHSLEGRTVNQKTISIRTIHTASDSAPCHLLFVGNSEKAGWDQLHSVLDRKNILTVSDFENFSREGGMIEFNKKDNRIQVALNIDSVTAAGLHIEDRLLKLVTVVHSTKEP